MAAADLTLPAEARDRLEAAVPYERGPLADFLESSAASPAVFGDAEVIGRRPPLRRRPASQVS
ncbi:hypothetical protein BG845_00134 [Pseudonocardia autotrophica]|uniref:Uncharacterized protein n=2 Tax=Pseudonocardia TaxID=1847 RepID=A0A1Y2N969_PSEAH|nr:hypothetical protein BG845_00134 [Pseudonocardia autotrophica]